MAQRRSHSLAPFLLIALAMVAVVSVQSCRKPLKVGDDTDLARADEPEQYSALVVRIVDGGTGREERITRETRSGDKRREEWAELGQNRALIWRPDLGKSFLLDLDRRVYVELDITSSHATGRVTERNNPRNDSGDPEHDGLQAIDRALDDAPSPTRVETRQLPAAIIEGHPCKVYEQRASFPDGHIEITRVFRATDLNGLALRVEAESEPEALKVITERREATVDVATDAFTVPVDFKKVERLPR